MPTDVPHLRADRHGITWAANTRNNAEALVDRLDAWRDARDSAWSILEPIVEVECRVAIVGAGNCDDMPLERIARAARHVDLIDIDLDAALRGASRLPPDLRSRVGLVEQDITSGGADRVLSGARRGWGQPRELRRDDSPIGSGDYDVVIGDLVYTQLLHPGLTALGISLGEQSRLMSRWDAPLCEALVRRLHLSVTAGGCVVHLHDLACWSPLHEQPMTLEAALAAPESSWMSLRRHDGCDPLLAEQRLGHTVDVAAWWRWPFQPDKQFLVRATIVR